MEATKCDRCGHYIDKPISDVPHIAHCAEIRSERHSISLCNDCYYDFLNKFLKEFEEGNDAR